MCLYRLPRPIVVHVAQLVRDPLQIVDFDACFVQQNDIVNL